MGKKEEITDLISPKGIKEIKVGTVLKFNFENSITQIRVTRKTKDRMWGEHVELVGFEEGISHYGHMLDTSEETLAEQGVPFCQDCEVPVREYSTGDGDAKAMHRDELKAAEEREDGKKKSK